MICDKCGYDNFDSNNNCNNCMASLEKNKNIKSLVDDRIYNKHLTAKEVSPVYPILFFVFCILILIITVAATPSKVTSNKSNFKVAKKVITTNKAPETPNLISTESQNTVQLNNNINDNVSPPIIYTTEDFQNDLNTIFAGAGVLNNGNLTADQREELFNRNYKGKTYIVKGPILDVGTYLGKKYITIQFSSGHNVDVYPNVDFDILNYHKEEIIAFKGIFDRLGTGIAVHHKIIDADFVTQ